MTSKRWRIGGLALVCAAALAGWVAPARALTLTVTGGGLTSASTNFACSASPCFSNQTFTLSAPAAASGTIVVDEMANTATIALSVTNFNYAGSFGGVDELDFTTVVYNAVVNVTLSGSTITGGGQIGSVEGNYEQLFSGGTVVASQLFNESASFLALNCSIPGGAGVCALQVGTGGAGQFDLDINSQGLNRVVNTFNLTVVPEPASGALVAAGLALLAALPRSRR